MKIFGLDPADFAQPAIRHFCLVRSIGTLISC